MIFLKSNSVLVPVYFCDNIILSHLRSNLFSWVGKGVVGVKGGGGERAGKRLSNPLSVVSSCSLVMTVIVQCYLLYFVSWLKCLDCIQTWVCPWGSTMWVSMVYYIILHIKKMSWSLSLHLSIFLSFPLPGLRHISFHQTSVKLKKIRGMWKTKTKTLCVHER